MRRIVSMSALLVLLVGLIGGGVATADDQRGKSGVQELTLYATETSFTIVTATGEVFPGGEEPLPSAGDRFLLVDTLYADPERTEEVGRNLVECTFVTVTGEVEEELTAQALCAGVVALDGQGDLAWQGQFRIPEAFAEEGPIITVAITGGTGAFERAGGSAAIFDETPEEAEQSLSRYEIRLLQFKVGHRH
jgi:hypothetical protein